MLLFATTSTWAAKPEIGLGEGLGDGCGDGLGEAPGEVLGLGLGPLGAGPGIEAPVPPAEQSASTAAASNKAAKRDAFQVLKRTLMQWLSGSAAPCSRLPAIW